jgi:hypothetical protein
VDSEFKKLFAIYSIEVIPSLDNCYYDEKQFIPLRYVDSLQKSSKHEILNSNTNNFLEYDTLSSEFLFFE